MYGLTDEIKDYAQTVLGAKLRPILEREAKAAVEERVKPLIFAALGATAVALVLSLGANWKSGH